VSRVSVICAWPRISWTIFGCSPFENINVAKVCLRSWNLIYARDRRENEWSLRHGWRVLNSYPVGGKTVWIITEADRSVNTILLPKEY
jgi:hypothetical protein